jgi:hypothetical protein
MELCGYRFPTSDGFTCQKLKGHSGICYGVDEHGNKFFGPHRQGRHSTRCGFRNAYGTTCGRDPGHGGEHDFTASR